MAFTVCVSFEKRPQHSQVLVVAIASPYARSMHNQVLFIAGGLETYSRTLEEVSIFEDPRKTIPIDSAGS